MSLGLVFINKTFVFLFFCLIQVVPAVAQIPFPLQGPAYPGQTNSGLIYNSEGPLCVDGPVNDMVVDAGKIYIAGVFRSVGRCSGSAVIVDTATKKPNLSGDLMIEGGVVNAIVSDGAGGWYIGGSFTSVGGVGRQGLAHISSAEQLDLVFAPTVIGEVKALYRSATNLYVGGNFTEVNGTARLNFAAVNLVSGNLSALNISTSSSINVIEQDGTDIVLGGDFDLLNSSALVAGAIFDSANPYTRTDLPTVTSTNPYGAPAIDNVIRRAVSDGNNGWIIAGSFDSIGGQQRLGLARINSDGSLHAFNPTFLDWNGTSGYPWIEAMVVNGSDVWLAGSFMYVNGSYRPNLVVLDINTGALKGASALCPLTEGSILELDTDGTNVYLLGNRGWSYASRFGGTCYGTGGIINSADGSASPMEPINGPMYSTISDGAGGWFIGGSFSKIGTASRNGLARINSDGSLHAFDLNLPAGSAVTSMYFKNGILYFSGSFTEVDGQARNNIAAYDVTNTTLLAWAPSLVGRVYGWNDDGTLLYFVGGFEMTIGGTTRTNIAAVTISTGLFTAFAPTIETYSWSGIKGIYLYGGLIYVAGDFWEVNGTARNGLVALSTAGVLQAWNPNLNGSVSASHLVGENLFVAGGFSSAGGSGRAGAASFTLSNGNLTSWNPAPSDEILTFTDDGTNLFVGGRFLTISGSSRSRFASYTVATRALNSWTTSLFTMDYQQNFAIAHSSGKIFVGANQMLSHGGTIRNQLASFDASTYSLTSWNPGYFDSWVQAMKVAGNYVYVSGSFANIGATARAGLGSVHKSTAAVSGWNPAPDLSVSALAKNSTDLFLMGGFTSISGQSRNGYASYNIGTTNLNAWNPSVPDSGPGWARRIAADDNQVVISGSFLAANGTARLNAAALDPSTGATLAWTGHFTNITYNSMFIGFSSYIEAIALSGGKILLGGIGYYGGSFRKGLAKTTNTGVVQNWTVNSNGNVNALKWNGANLFVGGSFSSIGGQTRNNLAEIANATGLATSWTANTDNVVRAIASDAGTTLYVGGEFTDVKGSSRNYLAAVNVSNGNVTSWNPLLDGAVHSLLYDTGQVYVGGDFGTVNSSNVTNFAVVSAATGAIGNFNPPVGGLVKSIGVLGNKVFIGGNIASYNAQVRKGVAMIDEASGRLFSWAPQANGQVNAIRIYNGKIYIGGAFTQINGQARERLASFTLSNYSLDAWAPVLDGDVQFLEADASKLYTIGFFTNIDANPRNGYASFDTTNGNLTTWNPHDGSGYTEEVRLVGNTLYATGLLYSVAGTSRNTYFAFDTATGNLLPFNPPSNNDGGQTFAFTATQMYTIGSWNFIGSRSEQFVEINLSDYQLTAWNPDIEYRNFYDTVLFADGSYLYFIGGVLSIDGETRNGTYQIDLNTKTVTAWDFTHYNTNFRMYKSASNIYYYGGFKSFEGKNRHGIYLGY